MGGRSASQKGGVPGKGSRSKWESKVPKMHELLRVGALTEPWDPWAWLPFLGCLCSPRLHFPVLGHVGHCRQHS